jgi:hypothetical protein
MPFNVTTVQPTPNPNALKFVLDGHITTERLSFAHSDPAQGHPVASRLFEIKGVESLLMLGDFVTVVKSPDVKWSSITGKVKRVLAASSPEDPQ